jgi:hypothetical protein
VAEAVRARAISPITVAWINEAMRETAMLRTMPCDAIRRNIVSTVGLFA